MHLMKAADFISNYINLRDGTSTFLSFFKFNLAFSLSIATVK